MILVAVAVVVVAWLCGLVASTGSHGVAIVAIGDWSLVGPQWYYWSHYCYYSLTLLLICCSC